MNDSVIGGKSIVLDCLSIGYTIGKRRKTVATGLTAEAKSGQLTCLIGRNGTGKSTLLRTIAGLQLPLSGQVMIGETAVSELNRRQRARHIAIVMTQKTHALNITAREMVAMGRTPYTGFWGIIGAKDLAAIDNAMTLTSTTPLADTPITQLSDGEIQKIMIAKALAQQTATIVLDEPTAFLDYPSKTSFLQLLARLAHEENKTILLSTHDIELAAHFADHYWVLADNLSTTSDATEATALLTYDKFSNN